ncbi:MULTISPECIES: stage VI sporulation protein D [Bacillota]|jgi:hypothetical protein|uniref:Stage VI sporulation protein D n=3 Tax=Erysipelotrichaceae TaxID=128827 RepID=A0A7G9GL05_9FIRM|nr:MULTISPECIES: stage VI sporulation protein D [Bacillota]QNM11487.1 stage VI sporulation protein D [[Eubacterium] hominis]MCH4284497.1 stage VI sporulation protein D [Amedibacillus hominis]RGB54667.1 stage VI sporulation protein D [Absiella sp. AM22-9]RGB56301.1 stage VI sporulation protein D [Absiella sp. AM10-20]RGB65799.1 stage VI sporulation protein D [Absiella sp. AM09-45]
MKTMKIEKQLLFADSVKQVMKLQVRDGLQYQMEEDGKRAIGPLFIKGQYEGMDGSIQNFQEVLDMDIMAPSEKLGNGEFFIQIEDYEGIPENDSIHLYITMRIHGLKEDQKDVQGEVSKKDINSHQETNANVILQQPVVPKQPEIEEIKPEPTAIEPVEEAVSKTETMEDKEIAEEEESQEDAAPITDTFDEFEDLFEDADTTYTSYRMIVAQEQDTYASIAKRYDVDEAALRSNNHDKEIHHKTLVILP